MCTRPDYPPLSEGVLLLKNVPLERGHVKCFMTKVFEAFKNLPLVAPLDDDQQQTLGDSLLYHIQWPRNEITVLEEIPPILASSTIGAVLQADLLPTPQQITRPSVDGLINPSQEAASSSSEHPLRSNVLIQSKE